MISFNINNYIKFKPTEYGIEIYNKHHREVFKGTRFSRELKVDSDGYSELQMHEFMYVYGGYAFLGGAPFIEVCEILIRDKDLYEVVNK